MESANESASAMARALAEATSTSEKCAAYADVNGYECLPCLNALKSIVNARYCLNFCNSSSVSAAILYSCRCVFAITEKHIGRELALPPCGEKGARR